MKTAKHAYCDNDPIPINEIARVDNFNILVDICTTLVNKSVVENIFPDSEKRAIVKPIVAGTLDSQSLSSFRPVSNLTFASKVIEESYTRRIV